MNNNILFNILKYIVLTIAIFIVLKYVLEYKINNFDSIITTTILVLLVILAETIYIIFVNDKNISNYQKNYCSSVCNKIEHMTDISSNIVGDTISDTEPVKESVKESVTEPVKESITKSDKEPNTEPVKESVTKSITEPDASNDDSNDDSNDASNDDSNDDSDDASDDDSNDVSNDVSNNVSNKKTETFVANYPEKKNTLMKTRTYNNYKNGIEREGDRYKDNVINNESEYNDYNMLPMADNNTGDFEYGYSFMPPAKWYPQPPNPPICVTNQKSNVMPIYTTGTPIDVKEWNESRRITPPDNIKTKYIKQKLNSGR